jgi:hypothetical protein
MRNWIRIRTFLIDPDQVKNVRICNTDRYKALSVRLDPDPEILTGSGKKVLIRLDRNPQRDNEICSYIYIDVRTVLQSRSHIIWTARHIPL